MNLPELLLNAVLDHVRFGDRVIDVGAGLDAPYQRGLESRASRLVLFDAHQPYLDANKTRGERVCGVAPGGLAQFEDREFDVAVCYDNIEHQARADGEVTLRELQRIADTVVVFTPDGFRGQEHDNYHMGADYWQTHRSGWTLPDLMDGFGFQIGHRYAVNEPRAVDCILAVWKRPPTRGRILIVNEFDPAGVGLGHRDALRRMGWDARLASEFVYTLRQADSDWYSFRWSPNSGGRWHPQMFDRDSLLAFAEKCDVLQVCPGIVQPWADHPDVFLPGEGKDAPASPRFDVVDWSVVASQAAKVAYFHGSLSAWANRRRYREWYTSRGYTLATSTLDYACDLPAAYLPPVAPKVAQTAVPRVGSLVVIHCPTNPAINHTADIKDACAKLGISLRVHRGMPHEVVMKAKAGAHAGFDHLRGSFSVNTLENAATGLVPLVGLSPACAERFAQEGFKPLPSPLPEPMVDSDDLIVALFKLKDDASLTRQLQAEAIEWAKQFDQARIGARLDAFYSHLLEG